MADADVDFLSLKELKALIISADLSFADCIDKSDLRARAHEAKAALEARPEENPAVLSTSTKKLGVYDCLVTAPSDVLDGSCAADLLVVVLHGLGASSSDLAPFAEAFPALAPKMAGKKIAWIFPQAPQTAIGAAWWSLDVMGFMAMVMAPDEKKIAQLIRKEPAGLSECRAQMAALLAEARALTGGGSLLPTQRLLVGGFSQGAITSLDLYLQQTPEEELAGVFVINGACIVVEQWAARLLLHKGMRVHISHGLVDQTLPLQVSHWTRDLILPHTDKLKYMTHPGGHDVGGPEVMRSIANFVAESVPT